MLIYANGQLVAAEKATVSVMDHGFLYGVGLFETVRVYNRRLFLWREHYARLAAGLSALRIQHPWTEEGLAEAILQTVAANGLDDAYVRLSVTGGAEGIGLTGGPYAHPSLFIFVKQVAPLAEPPVPKRLQPVSIPRQTPEGLRRHKTHSFLNNALAKQETGSDPGVEGLFLTHDGHVCEGIVSNVFWVKDGRLFTPSADTGMLEGVTRGFVLSLAKEMGLPVEEGRYPLVDLLGAEEAFVTNAIQEIVPVAAVGDTTLPQAYGAWTKALRQAYRRAVVL
ncbi:aminodeoxychorismate lyase [Brevibacillus sp. SYP-B805]|uniref:aminodeoxychorismate lyase n=1 Tax=Brevibacillus sp. SYP-B805 TaxID=1578199 RepID=UPI0013EE2220|nr:aminodeoxychorismate lyase [Brevibacillus sp. SYP-B805]NGQ96405.1 aminodeoxychorismate lyase [Brevibacillus sp. SYP-B805]